MPIHRNHCCALVVGVLTLLATGCSKTDTTDLNYKTAINNHYKAFPTCIWSEPKKFPVQAVTSDDSKTAGYDALTQEGLLTRTTAEKKESGTVAGAMHRAWIDTKVGLGAGDKSILESVEKGEDEAKEAYQEAIRASLPSDVAEIVSRQARSVQTAHDRVKSLRDGLAA